MSSSRQFIVCVCVCVCVCVFCVCVLLCFCVTHFPHTDAKIANYCKPQAENRNTLAELEQVISLTKPPCAENTGSPKSRIDQLDVSNRKQIASLSAASFEIRKGGSEG